MDKLLAVLAAELPALIQVHGVSLIWALLATAGCVLLYIDGRKKDREAAVREKEWATEQRRLNELVNTEIKNGTSMAKDLTHEFTVAAEAYRDAIAAKRAR